MSIAESSNSSASEPKSAADYQTEAELLAAEIAAAELAIREAVARLPHDLSVAFDIRALTRRYPWQAVGVAGGLGFAAAKLAQADLVCEYQPGAENQSATGPAQTAARGSHASATSLGVYAILTRLLGDSLRTALPLVVQWLRATPYDQETKPNQNRRVSRGVTEARLGR